MANQFVKKILALVVLCSVGFVGPAAAAEKQLPPALSGWRDAYHEFDLEKFLDFYAEDVSFRDPTAGITFTSKEQLRNTYTGIMQGRWGGNFRFDINNIIEKGNFIVFEGLFSLTYNGEKATIHFTTWLEFEDGMIKRQLDMFDYNALQRQLPTYGQEIPSEYTGPRN